MAWLCCSRDKHRPVRHGYRRVRRARAGGVCASQAHRGCHRMGRKISFRLPGAGQRQLLRPRHAVLVDEVFQRGGTS